MFARLVSAQVKTDKFDEGIKIWKEQDMPLSESVKGYIGAYLLMNRKVGKVISMSLWDTEEDAIADESSALHQKQVSLFKDIIIGEPITQNFEISAKHKID